MCRKIIKHASPVIMAQGGHVNIPAYGGHYRVVTAERTWPQAIGAPPTSRPGRGRQCDAANAAATAAKARRDSNSHAQLLLDPGILYRLYCNEGK